MDLPLVCAQQQMLDHTNNLSKNVIVIDSQICLKAARLAKLLACKIAENYCFPNVRVALSTVLLSSMVMVMGPTPPGTGVMWDAFSLTSWKATSPTSR